MRGRRAFGGLPVFGMAAAGVVVGHWISYRLALPDGHLRHHVLLTTGHGHWLFVVKIGAALALAGVATVVARRAGGRDVRPSPLRPRARRPAPGRLRRWRIPVLAVPDGPASRGGRPGAPGRRGPADSCPSPGGGPVLLHADRRHGPHPRPPSLSSQHPPTRRALRGASAGAWGRFRLSSEE